MKELILVATIHLLAVASPGPDFALVMKNSLSAGRRAGVYSAFGIALGIGVHVLYSIIGLAVVISQSIMLYNAIKLVGAAYLIYIGIKSLKSKKTQNEAIETTREELPAVKAFRQGFLTNILNPKATLFFLSLFTQVINPGTGNLIKIGYGVEMIIATFAWFTMVASVMTQKHVQKGYAKVKHHIDRVFGAVLIALGLRIALGEK